MRLIPHPLLHHPQPDAGLTAFLVIIALFTVTAMFVGALHLASYGQARRAARTIDREWEELNRRG